jgi:hypothetical protein
MNQKENTLTNDIARLRRKIKISDEPGFIQAVADVIKEYSGEAMFFPESIGNVVKEVKAGYNKELEELMKKHRKFIQSSLDL